MHRWCVGIVVIAAGLGYGMAPAEPNAAEAALHKDPSVLLRTKLDALISILKAKDLDSEVREKKVMDLVMPLFDFPRMAQLSLGKEHWPKLTPAQQERFTDLYVARLRGTYRDRLDLYTDERFSVKPPIIIKEGRVQIPTELLGKDKTTSISYKLYRSGEFWRIYDLEIEGISLVTTYRSQFDEILQKGSVEGLLQQLAKPLGPSKDPNTPRSSKT